jgi:hypothetical protein
MQHRRYALATLVKVSLCALFALGFVTQLQAQDKKVDGTWSWTRPGRNGGADVKTTLVLKTDGEKLTGTISQPGRQGAVTETKIEDGKVKGDEISFSVTRQMGGNSMTMKYSGKVSGDAIKGKIESERNGQAQSRDWEAKRETK